MKEGHCTGQLGSDPRYVSFIYPKLSAFFSTERYKFICQTNPYIVLDFDGVIF